MNNIIENENIGKEAIEYVIGDFGNLSISNKILFSIFHNVGTYICSKKELKSDFIEYIHYEKKELEDNTHNEIVSIVTNSLKNNKKEAFI